MTIVFKSKKTKKKLYEQIELNTNVSKCLDSDTTTEKNRGRLEIRKVEVFDDLCNIDTQKDWIGLKRIVKVTRKTTILKSKKESIDISYYISSIKLSAKDYNEGIRSHWSIENSLHYVKDVTFKEDESLIHKGNAPEFFSIVRNMAINSFRKLNLDSIRQGIRLFGGKIEELGRLISA